MKKTAALLLAIAAVLICLSGCSAAKRIDGLSNVNRIELRVHSLTDNTYEDTVISDKETVKSVCDTFSSLELKKYKTDKPLTALYDLSFFEDGSKKAVKSVFVTPSGEIGFGEDLFKITNGVNVAERLAGLVSGKE
jgi:hypothetical protein